MIFHFAALRQIYIGGQEETASKEITFTADVGQSGKRSNVKLFNSLHEIKISV